MADDALHSVVEEISPQISELAEKLGQSPADFLREVVEREHKKQWALSKLDEAVEEAEESALQSIEDTKKWAEDVKARGRARHA